MSVTLTGPPAVAPAVLHICVTCRMGGGPENPPGQQLFDAIAALLPGDPAAPELRAVTCLAACDHGCTAAIFAPDKKFSYLLQNLTPALAGDVLDYAKKYAASATGAVMPSRRAPSLANAILGRFPIAEPQGAL